MNKVCDNVISINDFNKTWDEIKESTSLSDDLKQNTVYEYFIAIKEILKNGSEYNPENEDFEKSFISSYCDLQKTLVLNSVSLNLDSKYIKACLLEMYQAISPNSSFNYSDNLNREFFILIERISILDKAPVEYFDSIIEEFVVRYSQILLKMNNDLYKYSGIDSYVYVSGKTIY